MITIYTDGGCKNNPGEMGIGVVVTEDGNIIHEIKERPGIGTNNVAEYLAIIRALEYAIEKGYKEVTIKSDSQLCVGQLSKGWKVNKNHLKELYDKVKELEREVKVHYVYIPREENLADRLSNMS